MFGQVIKWSLKLVICQYKHTQFNMTQGDAFSQVVPPNGISPDTGYFYKYLADFKLLNQLIVYGLDCRVTYVIKYLYIINSGLL